MSKLELDSWEANRQKILENCDDVKEIKLVVNQIQIELAGFRGRVWGLVAGISAGVSLLVTILTLIFGQNGILK